MIKRAVKHVIKIMRKNGAINETNAKLAKDMGIANLPLFSLQRFGRRDWKPKALEVLIHVGVVKTTEDYRIFLDEARLLQTKIQV